MAEVVEIVVSGLAPVDLQCRIVPPGGDALLQRAEALVESRNRDPTVAVARRVVRRRNRSDAWVGNPPAVGEVEPDVAVPRSRVQWPGHVAMHEAVDEQRIVRGDRAQQGGCWGRCSPDGR